VCFYQKLFYLKCPLFVNNIYFNKFFNVFSVTSTQIHPLKILTQYYTLIFEVKHIFSVEFLVSNSYIRSFSL
jgi:hypothetical protein